MASHSCSLCICPILFSFVQNALSFHALGFVLSITKSFFITISCNLPMWQSLSAPSYFFLFSLHTPVVCIPLCLSQWSFTRWLLCIKLMKWVEYCLFSHSKDLYTWGNMMFHLLHYRRLHFASVYICSSHLQRAAVLFS